MRAILLAIVVTLLGAACTASDAPKSAALAAPEFNMEAVAKIVVGTTTAADIEQLLGKPYRTTNYGDCNPIDYQEFWEYVGRDTDGWFRIHIEFDEQHIARVIARVPQKGLIQVLASSDKPQHQHGSSTESHEK